MRISQMIRELQSYIDQNGDKEVTSIGTVVGSDIEYTVHVRELEKPTTIFGYVPPKLDIKED